MATLYIWDAGGGWGHAALATPYAYVSWWPLRGVPLGSRLEMLMARVEGKAQTYAEDVKAERRVPEHRVDFHLDVWRVYMWWQEFKVREKTWATLDLNCAMVVGMAIAAGGGMRELSYFERTRFVTWKPADMLELANDIKTAADEATACQLIKTRMGQLA